MICMIVMIPIFIIIPVISGTTYDKWLEEPSIVQLFSCLMMEKRLLF